MKSALLTAAIALSATPVLAHGGPVPHAHPHGVELFVAALGFVSLMVFFGIKTLKKARK